MHEFALIEATCRHGRLVITDEHVAVRPVAGLHWRRHHWQVPREQVTGVSSFRGPYGRDLLIHTSDGHSLRADWVTPQQALPITQMLGYAHMGLPEEIPLAGVAHPNRWVRQGKLVVTATEVAIKPRFLLRRRRHWRVPRADITGVLTTRHAGQRMRYDLTLLTRSGDRLLANDVAPEYVIALTRLLGHTVGVPAVPAPVREHHAALALASNRLRQAPPESRWLAEEADAWANESAHTPTVGWGSRVQARERAVSTRFGTVAVLALLCVYATAALIGGQAMATSASYVQSFGAPPATRPKSDPALPLEPIIESLTAHFGASSSAGHAPTPTVTTQRP